MAQYKRKIKIGLRWFYKFDYHGTTYKSKCQYLTKTDASKAEAVARVELEKRTSTGEMLLHDLMNKRLDYVRETRSDEYYNQHKRYFKRFLAYTGNVSVASIKASTINAFLLEMHKDYKAQGFDNWKINDCLRILKALFYAAINLYDIDIKNPCRNVNMYRVEKKNKYIPTFEEIREVQAKCTKKQALLIQFCLESGARVNEAIRLDEIGQDYIVLYSRKNMGGLEPRKLPLPPCLKGQEIPKGRFFHEWSIERTPHFLMKKAEWGFHNLRHKFAIESMKNGMSVAQLMYNLGHSQLTTTTIYLKSLGFVDL